MSLGSLNRNFCQDQSILGRNFVFLKKSPICPYLFERDPQLVLMKACFHYLSNKLSKLVGQVKYKKNYKCFGEKRALPCVSISLTVFTFYLSLNIIVTSLQFYWIQFYLAEFVISGCPQWSNHRRFGQVWRQPRRWWNFSSSSSLLFLQEIISPSQPSECGQQRNLNSLRGHTLGCSLMEISQCECHR